MHSSKIIRVDHQTIRPTLFSAERIKFIYLNYEENNWMLSFYWKVLMRIFLENFSMNWPWITGNYDHESAIYMPKQDCILDVKFFRGHSHHYKTFLNAIEDIQKIKELIKSKSRFFNVFTERVYDSGTLSAFKSRFSYQLLHSSKLSIVFLIRPNLRTNMLLQQGSCRVAFLFYLFCIFN